MDHNPGNFYRVTSPRAITIILIIGYGTCAYIITAHGQLPTRTTIILYFNYIINSNNPLRAG